MADLSDVTALIASIAATACYPHGVNQPSVTGRTITIAEGWPQPTDLDAAFAAIPPQSYVTVFAVPGSTGSAQQVLEDAGVIVPPVHGMVVSVADVVLTVTGAPNVGEYLTLVVDGRKSYSTMAGVGDSLITVTTQLVAKIVVDYPGATAANGVITVPGSHSLVARVGAPATLGRIIHRQRQNIRISVWAPSPGDRSKIAAPVDVALKQNLRLYFNDTSQGIMTYASTMTDDNSENRGAYIRHLSYNVEYATLELYTGYEITSVDVTSDNLPSIVFNS